MEESSINDVSCSAYETTTSGFAAPELTADQKYFLCELENSSDFSSGLVLRSLFNSGEVKTLSAALAQRVAAYDKEIKKACNCDFENFVASTKQLITLRKECRDVKKTCSEIDSEIQITSQKLIQETQELIRYRKLFRNGRRAIEQLSDCLPVLEKFAKLRTLMTNKKYYQALRIVEELENTHLALLSKFRFAQILSIQIVPLREQIKENAYSEFKDFLENMKKVATRVGSHANRCESEQGTFKADHLTKIRKLLDKEKSFDKYEIKIDVDGSAVKVKKSLRKLANPPNDEGREEQTVQEMLDLAPIYRCCQIFGVMDAKEEFNEYYRRQRKEQCQMVVDSLGKQSTVFDDFVRYVDGIVGFFVIEDCVLVTNCGLASAEFKIGLWEAALTSICDVLKEKFDFCADIEMMLLLKKLVLLFAATMKSYEYKTTSLYGLLREFREKYNWLLIREYGRQFDLELRLDNCALVIARNDDEMANFIASLPGLGLANKFKPDELFPRKFPFSKLVVSSQSLAHSFLNSILRFMDDLQLSSSEVGDTLRRNANCLMKKWAEVLANFVAKNTALFQLAQILVNIVYLEKSFQALGPFITKMNSDDDFSGNAHHVPLISHVFGDVHIEVEQQMEEVIYEKIDAFVELADYNWDLPAPSGRASSFVSEMIDFLESSFDCFKILPTQLVRHLCMQTCKHLSMRFSGLLLSTEAKFVSPGSLEQFNLDVMQCEMFSSKCPVSEDEFKTLVFAFSNLRQLLDLVMSSDWTTFLAESDREDGKYSRVKPSTAVILLEKVIEYERRNDSFFGMNKTDRRKLLNAILQQLRNLVNQTHYDKFISLLSP